MIGIYIRRYKEAKEAIDRQELRLFYQPIVNFQTDLITGFEALIRWQHPTRGLLAPIHFIDIIEGTDLIYPVGLWVLNTACQQSRSHFTDSRSIKRFRHSVLY
ncbi:MAG: EAL domain-containing protein [Pseudanabaena sp.]|nr:EAL domain-containing protein [Pseudanabaena sp. M090S1SP2A07QC]MCA6507096.1 EAL domain-containing protein [Pseudanabaena sp. M172S2SP2A07QC]MCA6510088.1 EAL domain-containing protein [Pseudanabaena sp. M109S1SP2A07QC]MCA6521087.1 EAL domain-containing protein [Pseudanabaena sp. M051S1SP2A07QC]MCA6530701.1 EAL domain-containing protein [Pseudanabaena sp. M125S2SP2A07QC]MCA6536200.1 EAL domain-containing protein [Pseudanabaena sp. M176S2SP2A07QC]MCA6541598.1 EAL domain-containing protein [P